MRAAETMAGVNLTCAHSPSETVPAHADYSLPAESGFTRMRPGRITTVTLTLLRQRDKTHGHRGDGRATLPQARRSPSPYRQRSRATAARQRGCTLLARSNSVIACILTRALPWPVPAGRRRGCPCAWAG
jgi:hypothetical protein